MGIAIIGGLVCETTYAFPCYRTVYALGCELPSVSQTLTVFGVPRPVAWNSISASVDKMGRTGSHLAMAENPSVLQLGLELDVESREPVATVKG